MPSQPGAPLLQEYLVRRPATRIFYQDTNRAASNTRRTSAVQHSLSLPSPCLSLGLPLSPNVRSRTPSRLSYIWGYVVHWANEEQGTWPPGMPDMVACSSSSLLKVIILAESNMTLLRKLLGGNFFVAEGSTPGLRRLGLLREILRLRCWQPGLSDHACWSPLSFSFLQVCDSF